MPSEVMVATVRCEEIANEKLAFINADEVMVSSLYMLLYHQLSMMKNTILCVLQEWLQLEEAVQHDLVPGFGKKLSATLDKCLSG
ncbi:hypothetical protein B296_00051068 [Ensete ventricosum]|uniref:Uncharacterized protein n=1 Tax=Ensete ventricosum TaxID=4639 RepID=A0A426YIN6_ENSVE|nr:hypothetical protein B296_00051068 [Ensete ventricosum]